MEEAHQLGLPCICNNDVWTCRKSTHDIVDHFFKIVKLQEKTKGFMAFIPWNFEPNNTLMQKENIGRIWYWWNSNY